MNETVTDEKPFPLELFGAALFAAFPTFVIVCLYYSAINTWAFHASAYEVEFPFFARIIEHAPWIGFACTVALWVSLVVLTFTRLKRHAALIVSGGTIIIIILFIIGLLHSHYFSQRTPDGFWRKDYVIRAEIYDLELEFSSNKADLKQVFYQLYSSPYPEATEVLKKHYRKIISEVLDEKYDSDEIRELKKRFGSAESP